MEWLASGGARLFVPVGHSPDIDLIAELEGRLIRIEVKTSTHRRGDRWGVLISTRGGNRSWTGVVKHFDPSRCDYLFVHVGDGRRWFIPTNALECTSQLTLGGQRYSEFEVEAGRPLTPPSLKSGIAQGECPSGQREHAVNVPAMPTQVRILPPPSPGPSREAVIWPKRRLTIPAAPFKHSGFSVGQRLCAFSDGPGRIVLERIEAASNTLAGDDGSERDRAGGDATLLG
jgi:bifunctional DNA-binding transcriptional regulator/antitoxin component of YhaV-PrlF toxin-antitoxin module